MSYYKTNGFIYKIRNFSDSDKLVWVLTEKKGLVSSIAKGVRKISSRRAGHIDIFNKNRFSFHTGKSLNILTETEIINDFIALKQEYLYHFFYLAELIDKLQLDESEGVRIYKLLDKLLSKAEVDNFLKLIIYFELTILKILGFEPNLKTYIDTETKLSTDLPLHFSMNEPGYQETGYADSLVKPNLIKCQRFCLTNTIDATMALNIDKETQNRLSTINKIWLQSVLDTKFKSLQFLDTNHVSHST